MQNTQAKPMKEIMYRESRIAKALGEPAKYSIINFLVSNGPANVTEIAKAVHRHIATVSFHLAKLKALEIVRFEEKSDGTYYWIKYPKEIRNILKALNAFVKRTLTRVYEDI
ncbi:MAG: helix-turn-helix transcriptional regulator [candidate division WOR-3 bacterium]